MSTTRELERRANELREIVSAPSPAEQLAETERRLAASLELDARALAEKFLLGNARAIGSLASQLDEALDWLRGRSNASGVERPPGLTDGELKKIANAFWTKIVDRLELAEVVARRFPGLKTPAVPTVLPPGRRGLDEVAGLSIAVPRRHLFPVSIASDSPALRAALYQYEAHQWLVGRGAQLPEDLGAVLATTVPEVDLSERIAAQRAETQRRRAAVVRATGQ